MTDPIIRPAYSNWPRYQANLRDAVARLTPEQLAIQPTPERWPLWATIGHLACQRVSWLCGFLNEPGGDTTPFPDALYRCPGDEYLEPAISAPELVLGLESTFRVIEGVLERTTLSSMDELIVRDFEGDVWRHTRGSVIQRVFVHDVTHIEELNETFSRAGLPMISLWD